MQTYKPLHIIAILAFIIAFMACASRRSASDDLRSTATTAADVMATQTHAAVRTDTATTQSATADTMRQQTATSSAIDTDSCRLISHTDTVSIAQKKHIETDRRPLDRSILGYFVYSFFVLIVALIILLYIIGRVRK